LELHTVQNEKTDLEAQQQQQINVIGQEADLQRTQLEQQQQNKITIIQNAAELVRINILQQQQQNKPDTTGR